MNIKEALLKAKENKGKVVLGETELIPFIGRMGTSAGGGTYNDFTRVFRGQNCFQSFVSWDELISDEWDVLPSEEKASLQTATAFSHYHPVQVHRGLL